MLRHLLARAAHRVGREASRRPSFAQHSGDFCKEALRAGFSSSEAARAAVLSPPATTSNGVTSPRMSLEKQSTFVWPRAVPVGAPSSSRLEPQRLSQAEEEEEEEEQDDGVPEPRERKLGRANNAEHIGYAVVGRLEEPLAKVAAKNVFAVVQVGSHQFKVTPGDAIYVEKLLFANVNDKLSLDKVLMLGSRWQTIIGRPVLPDAHVMAVVEEHALDAKVIVFKKKRRKNYRRHRGHRQELTRLRILDIVGIHANKGKGRGSEQDVKGDAQPSADKDLSSALAA